MLCRGKPAQSGTPSQLLTPGTLLDVYGVRAAVTETADENGERVRSVTVLGSANGG